MDVSFCPGCGRKRDEGHAFCAGCGRSYEGGAGRVSPRRRFYRYALAALGLLVLLVVGLQVGVFIEYVRLFGVGNISRFNSADPVVYSFQREATAAPLAGATATPPPTATTIPDPTPIPTPTFDAAVVCGPALAAVQARHATMFRELSASFSCQNANPSGADIIVTWNYGGTSHTATYHVKAGGTVSAVDANAGKFDETGGIGSAVKSLTGWGI